MLCDDFLPDDAYELLGEMKGFIDKSIGFIKSVEVPAVPSALPGMMLYSVSYHVGINIVLSNISIKLNSLCTACSRAEKEAYRQVRRTWWIAQIQWHFLKIFKRHFQLLSKWFYF